jgi:hypothetical protein
MSSESLSNHLIDMLMQTTIGSVKITISLHNGRDAIKHIKHTAAALQIKVVQWLHLDS